MPKITRPSRLKFVTPTVEKFYLNWTHELSSAWFIVYLLPSAKQPPPVSTFWQLKFAWLTKVRQPRMFTAKAARPPSLNSLATQLFPCLKF